LYLRKNGTRTSASSIFESFDFFVQFAIVTGTREIVIQWLPIVIAVATVILTFVFLLSGVIWLAVLILMVGMIAAAVISIYRRLQLWPMAWVQADHPQLSAQQVIARCKEMTAGHIGDLLIFELSYLGVDRSALSAELGKMQREGLLEFRKNHFHLYEEVRSL
jgi:uncharacterized membrane protein